MFNKNKKITKFVLVSFFTLLIFTPRISNAFQTNAEYAILIDCDTSEVLYEKKSDVKTHPSSLTKLVTSYLIFEKLKENKLDLEVETKVSRDAWSQKGSSMFLKQGEKVSVNELLNGLITQSGNDAAVALAETINRDKYNFIDNMNRLAKRLGLNNSNFKNPIGLTEDGHYMSMRDIAKISQRIILDFPDYYKLYFNNKYYSHNNINQRNRNLLIGDYEGVDGLKTGHTKKGGYGISVSAVKNERRLIAVLNGMSSKQERKEEASKLLDYGFNNFEKITIFKKNDTIVKVPTWLAKKPEVSLKLKEDLIVTHAKNSEISKANIETKANFMYPLRYGLKEGDKVGTLIININDQEFEKDLVLEEDIEKASYWKRVFLVAKYKLERIYDIIIK